MFAYKVKYAGGMEYTVLVATEAYEVGRWDGLIIAACRCGDGLSVPDKGLGRATVAAWKTRHQDC